MDSVEGTLQYADGRSVQQAGPFRIVRKNGISFLVFAIQQNGGLAGASPLATHFQVKGGKRYEVSPAEPGEGETRYMFEGEFP